jgi:CRISPR-associated endonuclease/helicase Cas3
VLPRMKNHHEQTNKVGKQTKPIRGRPYSGSSQCWLALCRLPSMKPYLRFWAKTREPTSLFYHPVAFHGLDVAAAGCRLLETNRDLRRRLVRISGIDEERLLDWIAFLLALHDVGKLSDSFQALRRDLMLHLQERTSDLRYMDRHDALGLRLWDEVVYPFLTFRGTLGLESAFREDWADLLQPWLHAVFGHHGKPVSYQGKELTSKLFPPCVQEAAHGLVQSLAELFLPKGLPFALEPFEEQENRFIAVSWLFAGAAVAADWIGSSSDWFPFHTEPLELAEYWREIARPRAETAVRKSGLIRAVPGMAGGVRDLWPKIPVPTPLQALAESVELTDGPHLFVIEEVTGGGKTEAALVLAHRLMARGEATGLYFALPTMATANAMYGRVVPVYQQLYQAGESPVLVLAHSRRDLFLSPAGLEEAPPDEACEPRQVPASVDGAGWLADSRKKSLLAHVGVGTIDQALVGVLPLRHQSLRLLGLAGKVLIVDEVHACDEYVRQLLATLLRFHAAHGGSAVLLSATLPQEQRAELLGAFARGAGWDTPELRHTGYPLVSHLSRPGLREIPVAARQEAARRVEVLFLRTSQEVEAKIAEALDAGYCVAWIRNTVGDAREAYLRWRQRLGPDRVTLFHSRFTVGDRAGIELEVLRRFGPGSTPGDRRGRLLVASQVIEQSLDLDFDFLVSDLCPMDLVIQRAGRLHRHRRADRGPAVLGLFSPAAVSEPAKNWYQEVFPRAAWVYEHVGRLWLTARWLEEHGGFRMPEDARDSIEWVYGPASGDSIPPALHAGSNRAEGTEASDRSLALINRLKPENGYKATSLDWPDDADTPTRLGEPTVTLRLVRETPDGRYEPWHPEGPRAWQLSEVSVRRSQVEAEDPDLAENLLAEIRGRMRDEGRYSLLVILGETDGQGSGSAAGPNKTRVTVSYSRELGLGVERS